jgi:hypothetical protein
MTLDTRPDRLFAELDAVAIAPTMRVNMHSDASVPTRETPRLPYRRGIAGAL